MKKRYTDQQIAYALKEAEMGTPVTEVCRKMGISDATFYNSRKKFVSFRPIYLMGKLTGSFSRQRGRQQ